MYLKLMNILDSNSQNIMPKDIFPDTLTEKTHQKVFTQVHLITFGHT